MEQRVATRFMFLYTIFILISCLSGLLIPMSAQSAVVHGKVTAIKGDMVELTIGSDKGLREGDTGRVYFTAKVSGEPKPLPVYVAKFKVTFISKTASMAKIEGETTGEIQAGYLVEVTVQAVKKAPLPKKELSKVPKPGEIWKDPHIGMEFVWVPEGCFEMGDLWGDGVSSERPVHTVCVDGFWMGRYEVTQSQWEKLMGINPSFYRKCGYECPVEQVAWNDAMQFAELLSQKTGYTFRLPTEAEWEYACRSGGREDRYPGGDNVDALAWYRQSAGRRIHPVGRMQPSSLGMYDMSGNVSEWCLDWYDEDYYGRSPKDNPQGPPSGQYRVMRGGCWGSDTKNLRCSNRAMFKPDLRDVDIGFRLIRVDQQ